MSNYIDSRDVMQFVADLAATGAKDLAEAKAAHASEIVKLRAEFQSDLAHEQKIMTVAAGDRDEAQQALAELRAKVQELQALPAPDQDDHAAALVLGAKLRERVAMLAAEVQRQIDADNDIPF